jgi:MoxR-like ATPase
MRWPSSASCSAAASAPPSRSPKRRSTSSWPRSSRVGTCSSRITPVGKTLLARALAASIGGRLARIQATVDLLPADIVGANVWRPEEGRLEFQPDPIFANVVLFDEIKRATPKTQSVLLEAMEERQVTADGESRRIARPFTVVATQSPTAANERNTRPAARIARPVPRSRLPRLPVARGPAEAAPARPCGRHSRRDARGPPRRADESRLHPCVGAPAQLPNRSAVLHP